jgi:hypothetical protein
MTEFLSKISGQITGAMIIGTLFPVVLFLVVLVLVVFPVTPYGHQYSVILADPQSWKGIDAVVATLVILLSTVLLYQLNNPLIRLYEGYPWRNSWVGMFLSRRQIRHWKHAGKMRDRIFNLRQGKRLEQIQGALHEDLSTRRTDLTRELINTYPHEERLILPTRLGNVIRAFEIYTNRQYSADAIVLWPRLQGVLDANYAQAVDAVKSGFDFMLNTSFLSGVLALLLAVAGLYWRHPRHYGWAQAWEVWAAVFVVLSWMAYEGAINRAAEWGISVKAAFDLYRLTLLSRLGYENKPADLNEERKIWEVISYHFSFPGDDLCRDLPYRSPQVSLVVEPACAKLTCARTVTPIDQSVTQVRIVISNLDPTRFGAEMVAVQDEVPAGSAYVPDSAALDGARVELLGANPLHVQLGPLPYNEVRTLVYRVKVQPKA